MLPDPCQDPRKSLSLSVPGLTSVTYAYLLTEFLRRQSHLGKSPGDKGFLPFSRRPRGLREGYAPSAAAVMFTVLILLFSKSLCSVVSSWGTGIP